MQLNALHIRGGLIVAGVVLLGLFVAMGGSLGGERIIQLDFGMYPEIFEGSEVEIDGKVVGQLQRYGQATRSGFEVKKGRHTVRVIHPELDCDPIKVNVEGAGEKARLLLDLQERYDKSTRESRTVITLEI